MAGKECRVIASHYMYMCSAKVTYGYATAVAQHADDDAEGDDVPKWLARLPCDEAKAHLKSWQPVVCVRAVTFRLQMFELVVVVVMVVAGGVVLGFVVVVVDVVVVIDVTVLVVVVVVRVAFVVVVVVTSVVVDEMLVWWW